MDRPAPRRLDLGTIWPRWLNGGAFRLDGAAVGQLPRPVRSTLLAPDEDNRVGLAARVLLVETGDELGLIEADVPPTLTPRQRAFLVLERPAQSQQTWRRSASPLRHLLGHPHAPAPGSRWGCACAQ